MDIVYWSALASALKLAAV